MTWLSHSFILTLLSHNFFLYKINPRNRTKVFKLFPGVSWSSLGERKKKVRENGKQRAVKIITWAYFMGFKRTEFLGLK